MSRRFIVLCVICSVALVPISAVYAQPEKEEIEQELQTLHQKLDRLQSRLEQTQEEKQQAQGKLRKARQKETSLLSLVERYSGNIESGRQNLHRWKELEKEAEEELENLGEQLKSVRESLSERESLLKKRLRAIYKQGEIRGARVFLEARSMTDFISRARYFETIVEQDQSMIDNYRQKRQELLDLRQERQRVLEKRRKIRKREESWLNHLEELKTQQRQLLAEIRNRKDFFERRYQELEEQQKKVRDLVVQLQQERQEKESLLEQLSTEFGRQRGDLPWPVESRDVCRPFGEWEERGLVHQNDGIDVCLNEGSRVRAVSPGKVLVARPFRGMGKIVIIGHGGKYTTLYGSLVKTLVETGDQVKEGQVIGQAGQTAGMDRARLYFQIFEERDILNPMKWLK